MSQQEPVGMGADWLDETLTAEIRYQLYSGGSIAVLRFARELRQKHRALRPDPVGAALRELVEAADGAFSGTYDETRLEAAIRNGRAALSARSVQAITEAMVMDGQITFEQETGIKTFPYYIRKTLEAAFRVRPAPSDDAQRTPPLKEGFVKKHGRNDVPADMARPSSAPPAFRPAQPQTAPSTLAEFREQAIKVMEARADYWANNSQAGICQALLVEECNRAIAAVRALPVPEPWRPIETAPKYQWIFVYCPEREGLSEIVSLCLWHPDAGFCVDEIREPTLWQPVSLPVPPAKEPTK